MEGAWLDGDVVLRKLSVPGRPTDLDNDRRRVYGAYRGCGLRLFGHFSLVYLFCLLSH